MKKILALVLAVAMLSTTAFAAKVIGATPTGDDKAVGLTSTSLAEKPGKTIRIGEDAFTSTTGTKPNIHGIGWRLCSEYFTVSAKKFDRGANLVKEVKINDDKNTVDVVLKEDYALLAPKGANVVIKDISIKGKKNYDAQDATPAVYTDNGDIRANTTYKFTNGPKEWYVGFNTTRVATPATPTDPEILPYLQELDGSPVYDDGEIVKFVNKTGNNTPYATASLQSGDIYMEGRVYADDKVYVGVDYDVNKEVLKLDDAASMRFYNITTNGLPTANTLKLSAESTEFVYKVVDNKIVASGLKWSEDDYAFVGKIRSSASYVVSDVELKAAPAAEGDKPATTNPDTGANDVVGIAAALAVVSLVAAGAVSMKK